MLFVGLSCKDVWNKIWLLFLFLNAFYKKKFESGKTIEVLFTECEFAYSTILFIYDYTCTISSYGII